MRPSWQITALCVTVLAVACKSSDPPIVSPPDLQIVSAGADPRRVLAFRAAKGVTTRLEIAIDVALEAGEMGGPMPTVVMVMTIVVDAITPAGQMKLRATIDEVTGRDNPDSKVPAVAISGPLEHLKGVAIDSLLTPNGRMLGTKIDLGGKTLPPDVANQMQSLVASFEGTMMPLPDEPVGLTAVWRSSRTIAQNGIELLAVSSVSLTGIEGDTISFTVDTDIAGKDQAVKQGDVTIDVKDIIGTGAGKGSIDLAKLAVTSELAAELRSEMTAPDEPTPTKMRMTTVSHVRPL